MKKALLIICIALFAQVSYSQTTTTTTTTTTDGGGSGSSAPSSSASGDFKTGYFGARLLATFTSLKLKKVDNSTLATSFAAGYGGGIVLGINLSNHVGLQGEILYSSLAQKFKDNSGIDRTLKVNYINVPLLLMLNTGVSSGVNLNVCIGPQLGLNTGSSIDKSTSSNGEADSVNAVLSVKAGDVGFAYGAGLDFMISESLKLSLGFRGVVGLVDVSNNSQTITTNEFYVLDRAHVNTYSGYAGLALCF